MPEVPEKAIDSAEKAYAMATEAKPAKASEPAPAAAAKPETTKAVTSKQVSVPPAAPQKAAPKSKTVGKTAKSASASAPARASKPAQPVAKAPAAEVPVAKVSDAVAAEAAVPVVIAPSGPTISELKEKIMATAKTTDFTQPMTDALGELQTRAKVAYDKSTEAVSEMTEFAKGNVEALVETGKILAGGVQDLGKNYAEEAKSAYETFTADLKEAAAVKSPTELFQLQGKIFRRNFDSLVATSSKNTEAMIKLANEAFAPLSGRMNLAAEKLSKVA